MKFISVQEAMDKGKGKVSIRGWVYRERGSNKFKFVVLRDSSNVIQCILKREEFEKKWKEIDKIQIETSMEITGDIKADKRAPTGFEIHVKDFKVVGGSENYPITKDQSAEFLADNRHLWLRSRKMISILKIRSTMFFAFHEYLHKEGYIEAQAPSFSAATSEGGSSTFEVKYYNTKAFLSQSWQFYAESFIHAFEKVYAVAPSFRAEKSSTSRHLTEFWHLEVEAAWATLGDMIKLTENCITFAINKIIKENKTELDFLKINIKDLKKIKTPFPRITYEKAIKELHKRGFKIKYGEDLGAEEERALAKPYGLPLFVTNYPLEILKFYHGEDPKKPGTGTNFNLLAPSIGEIVDGSQREPDLKKIVQRLKKAKIDLGDSDWYLDSRRYGSVPHAGFGLGTERVLQWLLGLEHIRDALPFPRFMNRIRP